MIQLSKSDIFLLMDKQAELSKKVIHILKGGKEITIIKNELDFKLDDIKRFYKEPTTLRMINAISEGRLILFYANKPEYNLPVCLPFFKYSQNGEYKVAVNLFNYLVVRGGKDGEDAEYIIDTKKLYAMLIPAYYYLSLFDDDYVPPAGQLKTCAYMWAKMFNKVLIKTIGLSSNKERYDSFMFFAMKFFMIYYLSTPEYMADKIASDYLTNDKTYLIKSVEAKCEEKNVYMYKNFSAFCEVLFNNEFTSIRNLKLSGSGMNVNFYIKSFINMYYYPTIFSLASFPYFIFNLFSAYNWSYIENDKAFEDIVFVNQTDFPKVLAAFNRDIIDK